MVLQQKWSSSKNVVYFGLWLCCWKGKCRKLRVILPSLNRILAGIVYGNVGSSIDSTMMECFLLLFRFVLLDTLPQVGIRGRFHRHTIQGQNPPLCLYQLPPGKPHRSFPTQKSPQRGTSPINDPTADFSPEYFSGTSGATHRRSQRRSARFQSVFQDLPALRNERHHESAGSCIGAFGPTDFGVDFRRNRAD